jgi:hypothetical protein
VLPAVVAFGLYLLLAYAIIPIWQRYRGRYSRYIPLDGISRQTTSLREHVQNTLARFILPSSWGPGLQWGRDTLEADDRSLEGYDTEDGEELSEVDEARREAISLDASRGPGIDGRRLSRDLEEGFRDDSDDDNDLPPAVRTNLRNIGI